MIIGILIFRARRCSSIQNSLKVPHLHYRLRHKQSYLLLWIFSGQWIDGFLSTAPYLQMVCTFFGVYHWNVQPHYSTQIQSNELFLSNSFASSLFSKQFCLVLVLRTLVVFSLFLVQPHSSFVMRLAGFFWFVC